VATATRTATPPLAPGPLASDDFECGAWSCGTGWAGPWTTEGAVSIHTTGAHGGGRHALLTSSTGLATRAVEVEGRTNVHLQLWVKVYSFESGDTALVQVSTNGVSFTPLRQWTSRDTPNSYRFYDFDLSEHLPASRLYVRIDAGMSSGDDQFYFDDVVILGG
jgi:hypothetical protein